MDHPDTLDSDCKVVVGMVAGNRDAVGKVVAVVGSRLVAAAAADNCTGHKGSSYSSFVGKLAVGSDGAVVGCTDTSLDPPLWFVYLHLVYERKDGMVWVTLSLKGGQSFKLGLKLVPDTKVWF